MLLESMVWITLSLVWCLQGCFPCRGTCNSSLILWCWLTGLLISLQNYMAYKNIYLLDLKNNVSIWDLLCSKLNYGDFFFLHWFFKIPSWCNVQNVEENKTKLQLHLWVSRNWFLFQKPKANVFIKNIFFLDKAMRYLSVAVTSLNYLLTCLEAKDYEIAMII